ncbi:unnamed protein product [Linum trigynum]|uniref:Uncharacterized protein n=1 Tax=Linum trigynum TaxID=586398 RepID=A0AAV2FW44_9ROSI
MFFSITEKAWVPSSVFYKAAAFVAFNIQISSSTKSSRKIKEISSGLNEGIPSIEVDLCSTTPADRRRCNKKTISQRKSIQPPPKPPETLASNQCWRGIIMNTNGGVKAAQIALGRRDTKEKQKEACPKKDPHNRSHQ